jgi:hypothetical protein
LNPRRARESYPSNPPSPRGRCPGSRRVPGRRSGVLGPTLIGAHGLSRPGSRRDDKSSRNWRFDDLLRLRRPGRGQPQRPHQGGRSPRKAGVKTPLERFTIGLRTLANRSTPPRSPLRKAQREGFFGREWRRRVQGRRPPYEAGIQGGPSGAALHTLGHPPQPPLRKGGSQKNPLPLSPSQGGEYE